MLFLAILCFIFNQCVCKNTVPKLDLDKYQGRWFQIYGNNFDQLFEKFDNCITADYGLTPSGNVSVLNSQYDKVKGIQQIDGYAYYSKNSNSVLYPGELTVHLSGVPYDSPYWVYNLGPVVNGYYDWAIVSDNLKLSLFVLARNVDKYYQQYDTEVLSLLKSYGFNSLVNITHDDTCKYSVSSSVYNTYTTSVQSQCQIASYLRASGFPETSIGTMVCISKYESSYNCDAKNTNTDGSSDYGLFQINSYYWCSGDPKSKYNECGVSCTSLYNCQSNSNCAYKVWKQQGYTAWYGYQYHKSECDSYKVNC